MPFTLSKTGHFLLNNILIPHHGIQTLHRLFQLTSSACILIILSSALGTLDSTCLALCFCSCSSLPLERPWMSVQSLTVKVIPIFQRPVPKICPPLSLPPLEWIALFFCLTLHFVWISIMLLFRECCLVITYQLYNCCLSLSPLLDSQPLEWNNHFIFCLYIF